MNVSSMGIGLAPERQWYGSNGREKVEVLLHETNDCRLGMQSGSGTQSEREGVKRSVCRSRRAEVSVMVDVVPFLDAEARGAKMEAEPCRAYGSRTKVWRRRVPSQISYQALS